ncbi:serine hydrolase [Emcibacteraceae bacterium Y4]|nr:serine hydrolase [Pseudemcibacter aquimaris]
MKHLLKTVSVLCLMATPTWAKNITPSEIDKIVENAMDVFHVPGAAVGVIQDGKIIHSKGYGTRSLESGGDVDDDTYFGIASNSKGFTATALAILVSDGKIKWTDRVKDHLPEFELSDPWVTDHFTIADLLSHATGLPLGSGDLMWWPDGNYPPEEIIRKMKYLKPNRDFRTTYAYNNMPFIIAGAIIPAVTGKSYEDFLNERIFTPLGMDRCTANTPMMANDENIAEPHIRLDTTLKQVKRYLTIDEVAGSMAAAGIQCSLDDLLKWEQMHLNNGAPLMDKETHATLWQINTPMTVSENNIKNGTKFRGYGLGYNISDYHGNRVVGHGGALIGMYSNLTMLPEMDFAIAIVTNQQSGAAYNTIKNEILNAVLEIKNTKTAAETFKAQEASRIKEKKRLAELTGNGRPHLTLTEYAGRYHDKIWDGIEISLNGDALYFKSDRSPTIRGKLEHFEENTFIARWDHRDHEADSYVMFNTNDNGEISGFTMKWISNRTDFSYDFNTVDAIKQ